MCGEDVPVKGFVGVGGGGEDLDPVCDGGLGGCGTSGCVCGRRLTWGLSRLSAETASLSADMTTVVDDNGRTRTALHKWKVAHDITRPRRAARKRPALEMICTASSGAREEAWRGWMRGTCQAPRNRACIQWLCTDILYYEGGSRSASWTRSTLIHSR